MLETSEPTLLVSLRMSAIAFVQNSINDELPENEFAGAENWLTHWAINRQIYSEYADAGFLTKDILSVMLFLTFKRLQSLDVPITKFSLIKTFISMYATWNYNECSVASQCCRPDGVCGSLIHEKEGLDSETDDDDIHPSKRSRSDLGQIRDLRRFYEVDVNWVKKIALNSDFSDRLDYIDSMTVVHPTKLDVNLAIRVLESQKKLILQELARADLFLADSVGDDQDMILTTIAEPIDPFRGSRMFVVFELSADTDAILNIITNAIISENVFLIQETQAFQGVMVIPVPNPIERNIVTGFLFPSVYPYNASSGLKLDFNGPMSRVLLRAKQQIQQRDDYDQLAGKFSIRARIKRV